jgi:hypothetical protein
MVGSGFPKRIGGTKSESRRQRNLAPDRERSVSSRLFDFNGKANRVRKRQNRAIIAAAVRRFGHAINKDGVRGVMVDPSCSIAPSTHSASDGLIADGLQLGNTRRPARIPSFLR